MCTMTVFSAEQVKSFCVASENVSSSVVYSTCILTWMQSFLLVLFFRRELMNCLWIGACFVHGVLGSLL